MYLEKESPEIRANKRRNTTTKDTGSGVKDFNGRPMNEKKSPARAEQKQRQQYSPNKNHNMDFEDSYKVNKNKRSMEVSEEEIQVIQPINSGKRKVKAKAERLSPREEIQSKVEFFDKNSGEWVEQSEPNKKKQRGKK